MSDPPIFDVAQPDGAEVRVDLSAPSDRGDFTFEVFGPNAVRGEYFYAHHVNEAFIFVEVLRAMCVGREPADVLADIVKVRDDLRLRADAMTPTETAENNFDWALRRLRISRDADAIGGEYTGGGDRNGPTLVMTAGARSLVFAMRRSDRRAASVAIPTAQLWRFAAGMMWRSYGERFGYSLLSRLSTAEYHKALDAFEQAIQQQ